MVEAEFRAKKGANTANGFAVDGVISTALMIMQILIAATAARTLDWGVTSARNRRAICYELIGQMAGKGTE